MKDQQEDPLVYDVEHINTVSLLVNDTEAPPFNENGDAVNPHEYVDTLEEKTDSAGSTDEIEVLEQLVSFDEQRRIIFRLLEKQKNTVQEGFELNVIYKDWWTNFLEGQFTDARDAKYHLGPIDTSGIITDDGIFCDFNKYELFAVIPEIFNTLVSWYGLEEGTQAVLTYAITSPDGVPVPEYARPFFQLHHLNPEPTSSSRYSCNGYAQIPSFAISSLYTFSELVQTCIFKLDEKEKLSRNREDVSNKKFRVWVINDPNMVNIKYSITPSVFQRLGYKALIKKHHLTSSLKESGIATTHLAIEEKVIDPRNPKGSYWPSEFFIHFPPSPSNGKIGLQNLGNTCYMNSALQCLVHIPEVTHYFLFNCYEKELNQDNPLGMSGKVAQSFANLIHSLFDRKSNRGTSFNPREFKQTIGYFNNMFSGYHQQDSQEFFAFLLDGLHEDLNRIIKKPITEKPELGKNDADNQSKIEELAINSWKQHTLRNDSIIVDLFVGQYKSTLICPDCSKVSITFDPFSDLTLPLPVENIWSAKILIMLENGPVQEFEVELPKSSTYQTLKTYVARKLNLDANNLLTMEVWSDQFYRNFESSSSKSGYLPISDLITDTDKIVMYEVQHNENDLIVPVLNTVVPDSGIPSAFSLPFFVSLTIDEQNSFGAIRKKLEHKYEQLSTFHYFSKNCQSTTPTLKDFPELSKQDYDKDDYDLDISYADPYVSADQFFRVKRLDSSKAVRTRKKSFNFNKSMLLKSNHQEDDDCKVWTPDTNNNFTNLPDLLDSLSAKKKELYLYANRNKLPEVYADSDVIQVDTEENFKLGVEQHNFLGAGSADDERKISRDHVAANSESSSINLNVEPLTNIPDAVLETEAAGDDSAIDETNSPDVTMDSNITAPPQRANLIESRQAIVCEWDSDSFDIFFSGLETEGDGGVNTWFTPKILVNEEVEASKKKREEQKKRNLTLNECLQLFSKPEVLSDQDLWYCSNCKEHRQATKQIQIWSTPDILSIHLKRFENQRSFSDKIDAVVDFPIKGLDMSPYLASTIKGGDEQIYDLFAVDNHYGGIGGGHYTSYVKNFIDSKWYYFDDSRVSVTTPEKSITGAAYLLFYRKRSTDFLGGAKFVEMLKQAREAHEEQEKYEQQRLLQVYETNKDESSDEDQSPEEEEPSSSDNVSSIPVGADDEDGKTMSRRKQRLISRGVEHNSELTDVSIMTSDNEETTGADSAHSSDDNCSNYSCSVNPPTSMNVDSVLSSR